MYYDWFRFVSMSKTLVLILLVACCLFVSFVIIYCYNLQYIIYIILNKKKGLEIYVNTKKVIPHKQYSKEKKH